MPATGQLDALTSSGYLEGWAHDPARPGQPLQVAVLAQDREVARGLANRFRWDLAYAGCGIGWCAFHLRLDGAVSTLRRGPLILTDVAGQAELCRTSQLPVLEHCDACPATLADVIETDPTILHAVDQLRGCGVLFDRYLTLHGAPAFVRAAYVYILGRPADSGGLAHYVARLAGGEVSAYGVLAALHASDEFAASPRLLAAPTEPGFVFAAA
jgi:hypothetical protein